MDTYINSQSPGAELINDIILEERLNALLLQDDRRRRVISRNIGLRRALAGCGITYSRRIA